MINQLRFPGESTKNQQKINRASNAVVGGDGGGDGASTGNP